jgi:hypothetical protein
MDASVIDILNQCQHCGRRNGKYMDRTTYQGIGLYLLSDARGFKVCNQCKEQGLHIPKQKMNKSEKRKFKQLKKEMAKMTTIKHITLDAKGNQI